jgi:hypothetical protein
LQASNIFLMLSSIKDVSEKLLFINKLYSPSAAKKRYIEKNRRGFLNFKFKDKIQQTIVELFQKYLFYFVKDGRKMFLFTIFIYCSFYLCTKFGILLIIILKELFSVALGRIGGFRNNWQLFGDCYPSVGLSFLRRVDTQNEA